MKEYFFRYFLLCKITSLQHKISNNIYPHVTYKVKKFHSEGHLGYKGYLSLWTSLRRMFALMTGHLHAQTLLKVFLQTYFFFLTLRNTGPSVMHTHKIPFDTPVDISKLHVASNSSLLLSSFCFQFWLYRWKSCHCDLRQWLKLYVSLRDKHIYRHAFSSQV